MLRKYKGNTRVCPLQVHPLLIVICGFRETKSKNTIISDVKIWVLHIKRLRIHNIYIEPPEILSRLTLKSDV